MMVDRRNAVPGRERDDLVALCEEKHVAQDDKGARAPLDERSESGVDFTLAAGIGHEDLLANRVCCALQFVQLARNIRAARMRKGSDQGGVRNEFTQQPKALGSEILN